MDKVAKINYMELTVENLTKTYGAQKAVNDLSFNLQTGEVLGFLGPNGAGKSTTMKIITCYMAPSSGDVKANGTSVFEEPAGFKKQIGYLPESTPLYPDMFIIDYLWFVARLQALPKADIPGRIEKMIAYCGLKDEQYKRISELSKGYKQRVGLAQAMIHDPEVLILDEPTTGLDPNQIVEIRELIKNLGREKTILLSTHILPEAEAISDRILIINQGTITADESPAALRARAQENELLIIQVETDMEPQAAAEQISQLAEVENCQLIDTAKAQFQVRGTAGKSPKKPIFDLCVAKKWYLMEMRELETRLEDVFRQLTQQC